jgi:hypothetical protein
MATPALLDVYQVAYLAGGPDRAVDTAVVALLETGRIRAQHSGRLTIVDHSPRHPLEAAVLAALNGPGWRDIDTVRAKAGGDERLAALAEQLTRHGLIHGGRLVRLLRPRGRAIALTRAGRAVLRGLHTDAPVGGPADDTSAAQVALHGVGRMPDPVLRRAVFERAEAPRPVRYTGPRRSSARADHSASGLLGTTGGCGAGAVGGHAGHGCGGHGCGGGGCGGGG